jgi:hypothetical protein
MPKWRSGTKALSFVDRRLYRLSRIWPALFLNMWGSPSLYIGVIYGCGPAARNATLRSFLHFARPIVGPLHRLAKTAET